MQEFQFSERPGVIHENQICDHCKQIARVKEIQDRNGNWLKLCVDNMIQCYLIQEESNRRRLLKDSWRYKCYRS